MKLININPLFLAFFIVLFISSCDEIFDEKEPPVLEEILPIELENGLVAYYPFSGNANDNSQNSNNGIVYGAELTSDRNGVSNSAYLFDGSNDYLVVPADPTLSASTYQLGISLWVKINSFSNADNKEAFILEKAMNNGESSDWGVKYSDIDQNLSVEKLRFIGTLFTPWGNGGGTNTVIGYWSDVIPRLDTWYHLVINHDGQDKQEIFINGESAASTGNGVNETSFWENNADLIIGKATNNSSYFAGIIDDIRIYNRTLNTNEVDSLYRSIH